MGPAEPPAGAGPGAAVLQVTLAYAVAPRQVLCAPLALPAGATLADALAAACGAGSPWPERAAALAGDLQTGRLTAALWGRERPVQTPLRDGDRIELLRGLRVDPKQARRERYARHLERHGARRASRTRHVARDAGDGADS
jgi:putative ubiquitin-RnfH superfamily antitoxin RatB of RatAB toxin-antitoxin module